MSLRCEQEPTVIGNFKIDFYLEGLNCVLKKYKVQLQKFCDDEGLDLKLYEDFGWFLGRIDVVIRGHGSKGFIYRVKETIETWLDKINEEN